MPVLPDYRSNDLLTYEEIWNRFYWMTGSNSGLDRPLFGGFRIPGTQVYAKLHKGRLGTLSRQVKSWHVDGTQTEYETLEDAYMCYSAKLCGLPDWPLAHLYPEPVKAPLSLSDRLACAEHTNTSDIPVSLGGWQFTRSGRGIWVRPPGDHQSPLYASPTSYPASNIMLYQLASALLDGHLHRNAQITKVMELAKAAESLKSFGAAPAAPQAPAVPQWHAPAERLVKWLHCMSYNMSYFGEPDGLLKQCVNELRHLLPPHELKAASPSAAPQPAERVPLQILGARLADILDEDQWAECEALLLASGVRPPNA